MYTVVSVVRRILTDWKYCHRHFCKSYKNLRHMEIFYIMSNSHHILTHPVLSSSAVWKSSARWHTVSVHCAICTLHMKLHYTTCFREKKTTIGHTILIKINMWGYADLSLQCT